MSHIEPAVYKLREAATYLGVSPISVRRLIAKGRLKRLPFSRHVLVAKAELDRFIVQAGS